MQPVYYTGSGNGQRNTYNSPVHFQVAYPNTLQNASSQIQTQNQEVYRQHRSNISGKSRAFGVIYCFLGVLLVVIGAIGIYYGAPDMPYVVPLHIATGIMLIAAGICAFMASNRIQTEDSVSAQTKCLMIGLFCLSVVGVTICFVTAGINGVMGVVFCLGVEYSCSGDRSCKVRSVNDQCTENEDTNIAVCSVIIVVSFLASLLCILVTCFFCRYGRLFGIKNNGHFVM
ncbi:uncharacterized protein LOC110465309 [Mizuhopecten yessoensis]|uniref:Uncharacterized protein n=1 Tax=Mizuhopecten yessoensis TaxID=6573 RepID=A0A210PRU7_MIZYE|nr:uncharacterized protein LOC110465309 [Mizuhopecten yessoensis]OWF39209.1 hypothetical protein KP79_PYT20330 [Mizuhopecten yessoensis]